MAPAAAVASRPASASTGRASGAEVDLVRSYLRDIGRVPLLSHQQEITLGRQVQELMDLEALQAELKDQRGGEEVAREEVAKEYVTKDDLEEDLKRIFDYLGKLDGKIDKLIQS